MKQSHRLGLGLMILSLHWLEATPHSATGFVAKSSLLAVIFGFGLLTWPTEEPQPLGVAGNTKDKP
jgi:hypothetical protein